MRAFHASRGTGPLNRGLFAPAVRLALTCLALAVLCAACGARRSPTEVVIAATVPMSGSDAAAGAAFVRGCERAMAERNAAGGLRVSLGATVPVRLDARDDRSETPLAEGLVKELSAAGAVLVLATPTDVRAVAQAVVAERLGRPLVVHPSNSPGLPSAQMRWVFALPSATPSAGAVAASPNAADMEARGHATLSAVLSALEGVGGLDPVTVRAALQQAR